MSKPTKPIRLEIADASRINVVMDIPNPERPGWTNRVTIVLPEHTPKYVLDWIQSLRPPENPE